MKKAAKHFGEKKMEMIHARDITSVTGYIKGGCSPIGMKKPFPTVFDASAEDLDEIVVSGGKVGLQIRLKTADLLRIVGAQTADICVDKD
jgi:Cys-tRNA(Pro)/Cys-tRNA(Cys) deacylase